VIFFDGNTNLLCSVLALPTSNGPIIGRNLDWYLVEQSKTAPCLLKYLRSSKHVFTISECPDSIGIVKGISAKGFALAIML
jgi:predicted choloylglycine hydrolase